MVCLHLHFQVHEIWCEFVVGLCGTEGAKA
jgi:hypothetical protein